MRVCFIIKEADKTSEFIGTYWKTKQGLQTLLSILCEGAIHKTADGKNSDDDASNVVPHRAENISRGIAISSGKWAWKAQEFYPSIWQKSKDAFASTPSVMLYQSLLGILLSYKDTSKPPQSRCWGWSIFCRELPDSLEGEQ